MALFHAVSCKLCNKIQEARERRTSPPAASDLAHRPKRMNLFLNLVGSIRFLVAKLEKGSEMHTMSGRV